VTKDHFTIAMNALLSGDEVLVPYPSICSCQRWHGGISAPNVKRDGAASVTFFVGKDDRFLVIERLATIIANELTPMTVRSSPLYDRVPLSLGHSE
jgi:hypothetical protein